MMNDENKEMNYAESKIKKYAIALGSCALILAIMAIAATNVTSKPEPAPSTTAPVSETKNVEAQVNDIPDTRNDLTIVVPATEITTDKVSGDEAEDVDATAQDVENKENERPAPVSYTLPLGGDVGTDFSFSVPVYSSVMNDWRTHDGVDFNGAYGDGVKSIAEGIIRDVYDDPILGSVVTVDHGGGVVAAYCGVEASDTIKKGVIVSQGQKLGSLGQIPSEADAEYPHLHLEIRVNGELSDPLDVLGFNNDTD